jgi:small subunit ribosomal protein S4
MKTQNTFKVCRRLGPGVFDKCQTQKYTQSEARHAKSAKRVRRTVSNYAKQLHEKQRVRFAYGITERQLRNMVEDSLRASVMGQNPSERLLTRLEMRLDNIIYRAGLVPSRRAARQFVNHGHVLVNGVRTTIPSYTLKEGESFTIRERTRNLPIMSHVTESLSNTTLPAWVSYDAKSFSGTVKAKPTVDNTEMVGSVNAILEYYSR